MKKYYFLVLLIIILFGLFFVAQTSYAQTVMRGVSPGCRASGDCELDDFARLMVQIAQIILGLVGSLSLLAFVYGGIMFIISGGSSERVTKAKQILTGAIIGLVIVFTSYAIITFVFTALGIGDTWSNPSWFQDK